MAEDTKDDTGRVTLTLRAEGGAAAEKALATDEEPPVVTKHEIVLGEQPLRYTVTTGLLPIKNEENETEAHVFFMAYTRDEVGPAATRPLMFSFNGGPGSSSVWLHLGALGPQRVALEPDGDLPPPPYRLVDNEHTWLESADLVFIDPVGTGYSRAATPEKGKKFWSLDGDIASIGEFIRLFLSRHERWASPLFLVGESYGTTRAAGLAGYLIERGVAFNGIVLVSAILNFQTASFARGNDLPCALFLPTYAATAWFHQKLPADLQAAGLTAMLAQVEAFAQTEYTVALAKGDVLGEDERRAVLAKLSRFTGLSERFLDENDLRIEIQSFCKELLRDEKRTVGRLDSRLKGRDARAAGQFPDFDASLAAIRPPYTAAFNHYVRTKLGYKTDAVYYILGGGISTPWEWGGADREIGYPDTSEALRAALAKNPHLKVFVASGYYDLATPYFATQYTLGHMALAPDLKDNISMAFYQAGHMMYIELGECAALQADVAAFVSSAQNKEPTR